MKTKMCTVCNQEKELDEIIRDRTYRDGYSTECKQCRRKKYQDNKKFYQSHGYEVIFEKVCHKCKIKRGIDEFHIHRGSKDGHSSRCKQCTYRADFRNKARNGNLERLYGLTINQYNEMLEQQGGVCAISGEQETIIDKRTGEAKALAVDHSHETGKIRGLLCGKWNRIIGLSGENPELLHRAAEYLEKHLALE